MLKVTRELSSRPQLTGVERDLKMQSGSQCFTWNII
jgi:hypothetical protein